MTDPNVRPSNEVIGQAWEELLLIDTDWQAIYETHVADLRSVSHALEGASVRHEVRALTKEKSRLFINTLGSLALLAYKTAKLEERNVFEVEFGDW